MFDTITWHTNHVLTSVDIQQRYLEICRRAKKKIVIPEDIRLVEIQDVASGVTGAPLPAPLPLFSGQEIETKTGEAVYGSPQIDAQRETAAGTEKRLQPLPEYLLAPLFRRVLRKLRKLRGILRKNGTKKRRVKKIPPLSPGLFRRQGMRRIKFHSLRTGIGEMFPQNPAGNVRNILKITV